MTTTYYPPLTQRYLSSLIDGLFLLVFMVAVSVGLQGSDPTTRGIRIGLVVGMVLIYEPLLTSRALTLGQLVTGIRVRRHDAPEERIPLARAYLRSVVKVVLGLYSFLTMGFNDERRAVHDFAAGSVVLVADADGRPG